MMLTSLILFVVICASLRCMRFIAWGIAQISVQYIWKIGVFRAGFPEIPYLGVS